MLPRPLSGSGGGKARRWNRWRSNVADALREWGRPDAQSESATVPLRGAGSDRGAELEGEFRGVGGVAQEHMPGGGGVVEDAHRAWTLFLPVADHWGAPG